jgi:flavin reductase (DIM6/NTAB) family NADH-FMN oxidoreductase RutF
MKVDFSRLHRLFYPQVPMVLSAQVGARVSAMPVVAYLAISDSPPLLGIACSPHAFTYRLVVKAKAFTLCLLDVKHLGAMERLARVSGARVQDKLAEVGLTHRRGREVKAPVIDEAVATIECRLVTRRRLGDHALLVGEAVACSAGADFKDFWAFEKYTPILYTGWRKGMTTYHRA